MNKDIFLYVLLVIIIIFIIKLKDEPFSFDSVVDDVTNAMHLPSVKTGSSSGANTSELNDAFDDTGKDLGVPSAKGAQVQNGKTNTSKYQILASTPAFLASL